MEYRLVRYIEEFYEYREAILSENIIGIDTETTGLDPHINKIRLIQIAIKDVVIIIDCFTFLPKGLDLIEEILTSPSVKVFQNAKFDLKFFMSLNLSMPSKIFDTMLAAKLLRTSGAPRRVNLASLVKFYLNEELSKEEQTSDWANELREEQLIYAAKDSYILLKLREVLVEEIKKNNLIKVAKIEFECLVAIAHIEYMGIYLDLKKWETLRDNIEKLQKKNIENLYKYIGKPKVQIGFFENKVLNDVNIDSNKQILNLLIKNGVIVKNTSKHSLSEYIDNELVNLILEYRKNAKLISTFLYSIPNQIHSKTNRLHPKYSQIGASSGRMSCGGPNIQQIPRDKKFRECFTAPYGKKLIIADYSQIELRVAAEISKDSRMIEAYKNGEDLHKLTAALVSNKNINNVTKEERQAAKAMNFGLVFGMGAKGLQSYAKETYGVNMSIEEAEEFRNSFFKVYKGIYLWHKSLKYNPPKETRTLTGRKFVYKGKSGFSGLCNTPVQGTAADILKNALGKLIRRIKDTNIRIVAIVHDEIILETDSKYAEKAALLLKNTMEEAGKEFIKSLPIIADVEIAGSWAEK